MIRQCALVFLPFIITALLIVSGCSPRNSSRRQRARMQRSGMQNGTYNGAPRQTVDLSQENPSPLSPRPYSKDSAPLLIENARIFTAAGKIIPKGSLLLARGKIQKISLEAIEVPEGTQKIDGTGLSVTPGLIDVHSHMGVYPEPEVDAHADGNEMVRPITADVWAEHGFWPQDPSLWRALAGGVTMIQVLPGSGNLVGGRSFTTKLLLKNSAREMRHPTAPQGLKMACGENPKRVYKEKSLMTRMGNMAAFRKAFQEAVEYRRKLDNSEESPIEKRDLVTETLARVLDGEILVHIHCYRADDISAMLDLANEFGFSIRTFQHGLGAYKIAKRLAAENVGVATWADWWGFKAEAYDGIGGNAALLQEAGGRPIIHSDSPIDVRYLNVEAGKAMIEGRKLGLKITEDEALKWVTLNSAWALGLDKETGSIEEGKDADLVLWDGHPFSILSKAQYVMINGNIVLDRKNNVRPQSDLEVGYRDTTFYDGRDFHPPTPPVNLETFQDWGEKITQNPIMGQKKFLINGVKAFVNGNWAEAVTVVVEDGTITAVNPKAPPTGIYTIDGTDLYLTPGFIHTGSTTGIVDIELDSQAQDGRTPGWIRPDLNPQWFIDPSGPRVALSASEGVLTNIVSAKGGLVSGSASFFDSRSGSKPSAPMAVFANLKPRPNKEKGYGNKGDNWNLLTQLFKEVHLYMNMKKSSGTNQWAQTVFNLSENLFSHSVLESFIPVAKGLIPFVIRVERAQDIENLLTFSEGIEKSYGYKLKLVIQGGAEAWKVGAKLVKRKVPVLLTPTRQTPSSFLKINSRFDLAARLREQGVAVIITDSAEYGVTRIRQEAGVAVRYGMKEEEAIKAITETPNQIFALNRGGIQAGSVANLTLWSGHPLEPTSTAKAVWIKGELQDLQTRRLLLGSRYLKKIKAEKK